MIESLGASIFHSFKDPYGPSWIKKIFKVVFSEPWWFVTFFNEIINLFFKNLILLFSYFKNLQKTQKTDFYALNQKFL